MTTKQCASPNIILQTKSSLDAPSSCWVSLVWDLQGPTDEEQDAHMAIPDFDPERELGLFGVFDGHGGSAVPGSEKGCVWNGVDG